MVCVGCEELAELAAIVEDEEILHVNEKKNVRSLNARAFLLCKVNEK